MTDTKVTTETPKPKPLDSCPYEAIDKKSREIYLEAHKPKK